MDKRGKNRFLASPYPLSVRCGITGRGPPKVILLSIRDLS